MRRERRNHKRRGEPCHRIRDGPHHRPLVQTEPDRGRGPFHSRSFPAPVLCRCENGERGSPPPRALLPCPFCGPCRAGTVSFELNCATAANSTGRERPLPLFFVPQATGGEREAGDGNECNDTRSSTTPGPQRTRKASGRRTAPPRRLLSPLSTLNSPSFNPPIAGVQVAGGR